MRWIILLALAITPLSCTVNAVYIEKCRNLCKVNGGIDFISGGNGICKCKNGASFDFREGVDFPKQAEKAECPTHNTN